jgi:hypothetical protein
MCDTAISSVQLTVPIACINMLCQRRIQSMREMADELRVFAQHTEEVIIKCE